jgi:hypothetical protein
MQQSNLIPFNQRTVEEQRKIQSAGGKASGESRRRKKQIRELFSDIINSPLSDIDKEICRQMDLDPDKVQNKGTMATAACFYMATKRGDTNALKQLFDLAGEPMGEFNEEELDGGGGRTVVTMSEKVKDTPESDNIVDGEIV